MESILPDKEGSDPIGRAGYSGAMSGARIAQKIACNRADDSQISAHPRTLRQIAKPAHEPVIRHELLCSVIVDISSAITQGRMIKRGF